MPEFYVCPFCGSRKIRKEQEDDEDYCCDDCLEFFAEPKIITDENKKEEGENMKGIIDKEKLKELHTAGKTDKEIAIALNAKYGTVFASRNKLGLKANYTLKKSPKRTIDRPTKEKLVKQEITGTEKKISDMTVVDVMLAERNMLQERIFKLNQAIELLS